MNLAVYLKAGCKTAERAFKKNSRTILTIGVGVGAVATVIFAVDAGMKAEKILAEKRKEEHLPADAKLPVSEVVKATWKVMMPPVLSAVGTVACAAGSNIVASRKISAMQDAYGVLQTTYDAYQESVKELNGPKKCDQIENETAKKVMQQAGVADSTPAYCFGEGNVLFYEPLSGRTFLSDPETMRGIMNDINTDMVDGDMYCSVNDYFDKIGLPQVELGEDRGWNCDKEHQLKYHFQATSVPNNAGVEKLAWCIIYDNAPIYQYDNIYGAVC